MELQSHFDTQICLALVDMMEHCDMLFHHQSPIDTGKKSSGPQEEPAVTRNGGWRQHVMLNRTRRESIQTGRHIAAGALAILLVATTTLFAADPLNGDWQGLLVAGQEKLRLVLHITGDQKSGWKATMDSPDQQAMQLTVDSVNLENKTFTLEMKRIQAVFKGKLDDKTSSIAGTWSQQGQSIPVTFNKVQKAANASSPTSKPSHK